MAERRVLILGFDPRSFPEYDAVPVLAALEEGLAGFEGTDLVPTQVLLPLDDEILPRMREAVAELRYDCVVVGGGIRKPADLLELFEAAVNVVHREAPQAVIAFNSSPSDTYSAARRALDADGLLR